MSKFCPTCHQEFQDEMLKCPIHGIELRKKLKETKPHSTAVDIYAARDEVEAERIVSFLSSEGIETVERQANIAQIPVASQKTFLITVPSANKLRAIQLIQAARNDGIISRSGIFL